MHAVCHLSCWRMNQASLHDTVFAFLSSSVPKPFFKTSWGFWRILTNIIAPVLLCPGESRVQYIYIYMYRYIKRSVLMTVCTWELLCWTQLVLQRKPLQLSLHLGHVPALPNLVLHHASHPRFHPYVPRHTGFRRRTSSSLGLRLNCGDRAFQNFTLGCFLLATFPPVINIRQRGYLFMCPVWLEENLGKIPV